MGQTIQPLMATIETIWGVWEAKNCPKMVFFQLLPFTLPKNKGNKIQFLRRFDVA